MSYMNQELRWVDGEPNEYGEPMMILQYSRYDVLKGKVVWKNVPYKGNVKKESDE